MRGIVDDLLRILGIAHGVHFIWATLGGGLVVAGVVAAVLSQIPEVPQWAILAIFVGMTLVMAGAIGLAIAWWRRRSEPGPDLAKSFIKGERLYLPDLVRFMAGHPLIADRTFEDCEIEGPAVVTVLSSVSLIQVIFSGTSPEGMLYAVPNGRDMGGVIGIQRTTFRRCRFYNIAFMGTPEDIDLFRQSVGVAISVPMSALSTEQPMAQEDEKPPEP